MAGRKRLIFAAFPAIVALIKVRPSGCAAAQVGEADRTIIMPLFGFFIPMATDSFALKNGYFYFSDFWNHIFLFPPLPDRPEDNLLLRHMDWALKIYNKLS